MVSSRLIPAANKIGSDRIAPNGSPPATADLARTSSAISVACDPSEVLEVAAATSWVLRRLSQKTDHRLLRRSRCAGKT
jgi:hypothetical protein